MKQTTNLKLKKPDSGDQVLISDLNENADILDSAVNGKLDKSGGTMTGDLTVGQAKVGSNGYFQGTWLQTTGATDLGNSDKIAVINPQGWIYYRSKAGVITDLGIDQKADKSEIPKNTSQLTNNSGYITNTTNGLTNYYNKTTVDSKLGNKADSTTVTELDKRIKALENIPNANGVSY